MNFTKEALKYRMQLRQTWAEQTGLVGKIQPNLLTAVRQITK